MSKNIKILENSVEKTIKNVVKIKTQLANGGQCYWVPKDNYPLGILTITQDGVYTASSDLGGPFYGYSEVNVEGVGTTEMGTLGQITITGNGTYVAATDSQGPFYGYSKVVVNVSDADAKPDHVSGKDSDGDDVVVRPDPETGVLDEEKVPSRIEVVTPPTKTDYTDGETINYTGIVVKAYYETSGEWGTVPYNELVFPETTASCSNAEGWTDGTGINAVFVTYSPHLWTIMYNDTGRTVEGQIYCAGTSLGTYSGRPCTLSGRDASDSLLVTKYSRAIYYLSLTGNPSKIDLCAYYNGEETPYAQNAIITGWYSVGTTSGRAGIDRFKGDTSWYNYLTGLPESTVDPSQTGLSSMHASQNLPVQWPRPGDNKVLETTFTITVEKPDDGGSSDFPPQPE